MFLLAVDARYEVTYYWLFIEFFCAKVAGIISSEGFLIQFSIVLFITCNISVQLHYCFQIQ